MEKLEDLVERTATQYTNKIEEERARMNAKRRFLRDKESEMEAAFHRFASSTTSEISEAVQCVLVGFSSADMQARLSHCVSRSQVRPGDQT